MRNLSRTLLMQITALVGIAAVTAFSAFTLAEASEVSPGKPKHCYLSDASALAAGEVVNGPARVLDLKGRKGIHPTSIHTTIKLARGHTLNEPQGTLVLWFFSLEDLAASFVADHMKMQNEFFDNYTFLSDFDVPRNYPPANFCFLWNRFNEFRAKFFKGTVYPTHEGFQPPQKAWVQAVPFNHFQQHRWYQCAVTWDDSAKSASLFVNGVLLGKSDVFKPCRGRLLGVVIHRNYVQNYCSPPGKMTRLAGLSKRRPAQLHIIQGCT